MIIQCPKCSTRFSITEEAIANIVAPQFHCSRCSNYFTLAENAYQGGITQTTQPNPQVAASTKAPSWESESNNNYPDEFEEFAVQKFSKVNSGEPSQSQKKNRSIDAEVKSIDSFFNPDARDDSDEIAEQLALIDDNSDIDASIESSTDETFDFSSINDEDETSRFTAQWPSQESDSAEVWTQPVVAKKKWGSSNSWTQSQATKTTTAAHEKEEVEEDQVDEDFGLEAAQSESDSSTASKLSSSFAEDDLEEEQEDYEEEDEQEDEEDYEQEEEDEDYEQEEEDEFEEEDEEEFEDDDDDEEEFEDDESEEDDEEEDDEVDDEEEDDFADEAVLKTISPEKLEEELYNFFPETDSNAPDNFSVTFGDFSDRDETTTQSDNAQFGQVLDFPPSFQETATLEKPNRVKAKESATVAKSKSNFSPIALVCSAPILLLIALGVISNQSSDNSIALSQLRAIFEPNLPATPPSGVEIIDLTSKIQPLNDGLRVIEISGSLYNATLETFRDVAIRAQVFSNENHFISEVIAPADNSLLNASIRTLDIQSLNELQQKPSSNESLIRPNEKLPFKLILATTSGSETWFSTKVHSVLAATTERLLRD